MQLCSSHLFLCCWIPCGDLLNHTGFGSAFYPVLYVSLVLIVPRYLQFYLLLPGLYLRLFVPHLCYYHHPLDTCTCSLHQLLGSLTPPPFPVVHNVPRCLYSSRSAPPITTHLRFPFCSSLYLPRARLFPATRSLDTCRCAYARLPSAAGAAVPTVTLCHIYFTFWLLIVICTCRWFTVDSF